MLLRVLEDMLVVGGIIFWFFIFCLLGVMLIVTILERRAKRGLESDG